MAIHPAALSKLYVFYFEANDLSCSAHPNHLARLIYTSVNNRKVAGRPARMHFRVNHYDGILLFRYYYAVYVLVSSSQTYIPSRKKPRPGRAHKAIISPLPEINILSNILYVAVLLVTYICHDEP